MAGEVDATREIFGYTSHIPVPAWVDKNLYNQCHHCKITFSAFKEQQKPHHCRLCGHMYCGSCTAKYHVPLIYETKGKKGPTRVCIRCRDSCLAQKEREQQAVVAQQPVKHAVLSSKDLLAPTGAAAVRQSQFVGGPNVIEIAPPVWDDHTKYIECAKCHKKGGHPHNCRTCGHLYCDDCTTKMSLPPYFEKKAKTGPCRVCGECRFKILGGAKLVERLSTDLPELDNVTRGSIKGSLNASITCTAPGCTSARVSKNGYCAVHVNEFGAGGAELATSASIAVRWEGGASVLTKVAVTDKSMNLLQVDMAFRKQCPDFARRGDDFEYLYKGEGIAEVFYDLFTVQHFVPFGSQVMIRKRVDTDLLVAQYARQNVAGRATAALNNTRGSFHTAAAANQVDAATAASSQPTARINPFARKPGSSDSDAPGMFSRKAPVVKAEPVKKVFRKPGSGGQIPSKFALANANGAGGAASIKKGPPSLPGAGGASSSGGPPPPPGAKAGPPALPSAAVTDLKVRAQKYFGSY